MSTAATTALDPTAVTEAILTTDPTAATEAAMDIASIKEMMDGFDPAALLPELDRIFGSAVTVCRWAVMIAPLVLLVLGLAYLFLSPKEANYYFGYRCYYGMGSVEAWRFTQRWAGIALSLTGLILSGIMLVMSMGFPGMDTMEMVWKAFWCLIWQGVIALLANAGIWIAAALRFDAKGNFRKKKRMK